MARGPGPSGAQIMALLVTSALALAAAQSFSGTTCGPRATNSTIASMAFCNKSLPIEARLKLMVSMMTTAEKIPMLNNGNQGVPRLGLRPMQVPSACALHPNRSWCNPNDGPGDGLGGLCSLVRAFMASTPTAARLLAMQTNSALAPGAQRVTLPASPKALRSTRASGSLWVLLMAVRDEHSTTRKTLTLHHRQGP